MSNSQPLLIVVGGPNGSGKITLVDYLVYKGKIESEIINPDKIAKLKLGGFSII
jgi:predicted ABC-type ATPase